MEGEVVASSCVLTTNPCSCSIEIGSCVTTSILYNPFENVDSCGSTVALSFVVASSHPRLSLVLVLQHQHCLLNFPPTILVVYGAMLTKGELSLVGSCVVVGVSFSSLKSGSKI